jgi:excisionase family DNA binding protein
VSTYLTDDEVAQRLHVDRKQVQALARQGAIKGFKVGQKWRFTEAAFLAYTGESASESPAVQLLGLHPKTARSIRRRAS